MIIDSHQHFWKLSRGDYSWMTPDMKKLYKDFFPSDLEPLIKEKNKFIAKFGTLNSERAAFAKSQSINKDILSITSRI